MASLVSGARLVAILGALGVFGALSASAATLGGTTSSSLGADQSIVTSCQHGTGIALTFTSDYDAATGSFQTTAATLSGVDAACAGKHFTLVLTGTVASLAEVTGTLDAPGVGPQTVTLPVPIDAAAITKAGIVVTG